MKYTQDEFGLYHVEMGPEADRARFPTDHLMAIYDDYDNPIQVKVHSVVDNLIGGFTIRCTPHLDKNEREVSDSVDWNK